MYCPLRFDRLSVYELHASQTKPQEFFFFTNFCVPPLKGFRVPPLKGFPPFISSPMNFNQDPSSQFITRQPENVRNRIRGFVISLEQLFLIDEAINDLWSEMEFYNHYDDYGYNRVREAPRPTSQFFIDIYDEWIAATDRNQARQHIQRVLSRIVRSFILVPRQVAFSQRFNQFYNDPFRGRMYNTVQRKQNRLFHAIVGDLNTLHEHNTRTENYGRN